MTQANLYKLVSWSREGCCQHYSWYLNGTSGFSAWVPSRNLLGEEQTLLSTRETPPKPKKAGHVPPIGDASWMVPWSSHNLWWGLRAAASAVLRDCGITCNRPWLVRGDYSTRLKYIFDRIRTTSSIGKSQGVLSLECRFAILMFVGLVELKTDHGCAFRLHVGFTFFQIVCCTAYTYTYYIYEYTVYIYICMIIYVYVM